MHLRGNVKYGSWESLWKEGYRSPFFQANHDEKAEEVDWSLSERQLFTQSNGRTLIGQDTKGRLHFVCTPHEKIYAIPSGGTDVGGQFKGHIGQYYQNDTALFLGKMQYDIELNNGLLVPAADKSANTLYLDHFLPFTETIRPEFETRVFSLAPIMEKEAIQQSSIHPLPGPAAVYFCVEVKNTSGSRMKGRVRLSFDDRFVNQFEQYGKLFEDYAVPPYNADWEQRLLVLWHPEACAAIQLLGGTGQGNPWNPIISAPLDLEPGESKVFSAIVAVTPNRNEIHEALGIIYQHSALEWINVTERFWRERFGELKMGIHENQAFADKYKDMQIRFILDNFNCLSFGTKGDLLTNRQGAPSHSLSRLWGIDIAPDVVSVMYAVPEVGPMAIEYLLKRNAPRYSIYSDHSTFFFISPLVIAAKYLELTGDKKYFRDNPEIIAEFEEIYSWLLKHKHKDKALFTSRYASDLIVFRKYDYGANVQCYYALKGYRGILEAVGKNTLEVDDLLTRLPADLAETMEGEGPFGRQITGGSNLNESKEERFYVADDLYYYAGEDTATVLAPLYGLYDFDYEPYVNLHRYARSMFITCYDPEFQTMRELHFGMNPSATGCTLRLGGSYTRKEMLYTLDMLYGRLDETGSLFWWPRAYNKKRCLTRCSQGQGAWIQQSIEQWLGIRINGAQETLLIQPQGLLTSYTLESGHIGAYAFDISYEETETGTTFKVKNKNEKTFKVILAARPYGTAAEGKMVTKVVTVEPGEEIEKLIKTNIFTVQEAKIVQQECQALGGDQIEFGPYGIVMPKLYSGDCETFLLRFVIAHNEEEAWKNIEIELDADPQWKVTPKGFYHWDYQPIFKDNKARGGMEELAAGKHGVIGFYINLPVEFADNETSVMLSNHMFQQPFSQSEKELRLYIRGEKKQDFSPLVATLRVDEKVIKKLEIPVIVCDKETYSQKYDIMYHG